jgi:hypothetical protein
VVLASMLIVTSGVEDVEEPLVVEEPLGATEFNGT